MLNKAFDRERNYRGGFVVPLVIAIIVLLSLCGGIYMYYRYTTCSGCGGKGIPPARNINATTTNNLPIVGGDRDEHGCIGSAGYTWCAIKNKCLRVWEESCVATSTCSCPAGYRQEGEVCNPECYYNTPQCLIPSITCKK